MTSFQAGQSHKSLTYKKFSVIFGISSQGKRAFIKLNNNII